MFTVRARYFVVAVFSFSCTLLADELANDPYSLRIPGIVWGEETNGVQAGMTDSDSGSKGIITIVRSRHDYTNVFFLAPPNGKFVSVELLDTNGAPIKPYRGKELVGELPQKIPIKDFPRFPDTRQGHKVSSHGFRDLLIGNPAVLKDFSLRDIYAVREGDYTLKICIAIYQYNYTTNASYAQRVDLPCVIKKVHLMPKTDE
jgi:hypothetical protein